MPSEGVTSPPGPTRRLSIPVPLVDAETVFGFVRRLPSPQRTGDVLCRGGWRLSAAPGAGARVVRVLEDGLRRFSPRTVGGPAGIPLEELPGRHRGQDSGSPLRSTANISR